MDILLHIFSFDFKPGNFIPAEFFTEIADAHADNLETLVGIVTSKSQQGN